MTDMQHIYSPPTRVPLMRFKHVDGVVREVEEDDEATVHIDGTVGVQAANKAKHLAVQSTAVLLHELGKVPAGQFRGDILMSTLRRENIISSRCCGESHLRGGFGMRLRQEASESSSEPKPLYGGSSLWTEGGCDCLNDTFPNFSGKTAKEYMSV